jgi:molybdopterin molybdotransferase
MKEFFKVKNLSEVFGYAADFPCVGTEDVPLLYTAERVLAADIISGHDIPDFPRSTMDGYALRGSSTFGASEGNPAYLTIVGSVTMGQSPEFTIGPGEACRISTGGMLPAGADSVVMIEHTEALDDTSLEVYRSVAPGQHVIQIGEDVKKGDVVISGGKKLRPQESGLLAAIGKTMIRVYKKPVVGIISTGDEIVPVEDDPGPAQIRDTNSYTLFSQVQQAGGQAELYGIIGDDYNLLYDTCARALAQSDMVLISGGSSVGTRDFTIEVLSNLPQSSILVHGISIRPGKPTILAKAQNKAVWGMPGHVASAMIVFKAIVQIFIERIAGLRELGPIKPSIYARLSRNLASAQGRVDYIRVRLMDKAGELWAEPILGKSGLINTMVKADGMVAIDINTEGLDKGTTVEVFWL